MPKVSIITPLYNDEHFVQEALRAVASQTMRDFEHIVINDGSTDLSPQIVRSSAPWVRLVCQENGGTAKACNHGISLCSGEFVAFLESDDLWVPERLDQHVCVLQSDPSIGLVLSDFHAIGEDGSILSYIRGKSEDSFSRLFLQGYAPLPSAITVRSSVFKQAGIFDETFRPGHLQDVEWFTRVASVTQFHCIPSPLLSYRTHPPKPNRDSAERSFRHWNKLLDLLSAKYAHDRPRQRWIAAKRVAVLSDYGYHVAKAGEIDGGLRYLRAALALGVRRVVNQKMVCRTALRYLRVRIAFKQVTS